MFRFSKNIIIYPYFQLRVTICLSIVIISQFTLGQTCSIQTGLGNMTDEIQLIVNLPDSSGMSGREKNIWDLQSHKNRLYLGYGSTTTNPGPIDLYAIDVQNNYTPERSIPTEAIEKIRVYDDTLYIPNSDPLGGSSDLRKLDFKDLQNQWSEAQWSPSLAHVRDVIMFRDSLYFMGNSWSPGSKSSLYSGIHYDDPKLDNIQLDLISSELSKAGDLTNGKWNWFFGGFVFKDTLILPNAMLTLAYDPTLTIPHNMAFMKTDTTVWSAYMNQTQQLKHHNLYPVDLDATTKVLPDADISVRPYEYLEYNDKLLIVYRTYSIHQDTYTSQYNNSAGMICKSSILDTAEFISFPNSNAIGEDILLIDDAVFVLTNEKISNTQFKTTVYRSTDPTTDATAWTEVFHYFSSNLARSFEYYYGYFYFGKGSNFGDDINQCGELIRIPTNCFGLCSNIGSSCDDYDLCTMSEQIDNNCDCIGLFADIDGDGICDSFDCMPSLYLGNLSSTNSMYHASQTIYSNAVIQMPSNIEFSAGQQIELQPDFEIKSNLMFHAYIADCN